MQFYMILSHCKITHFNYFLINLCSQSSKVVTSIISGSCLQILPFESIYGSISIFVRKPYGVCNKGTLSCHFQLVRHNLHNLKPYLYLNQSINQLGTIVEQGLEPCTWNLSTISFTKRLTPANTFLAIHENRHTTVSNNVFRAMRCTRHTKCRLQPNHRAPASKQHNLTA